MFFRTHFSTSILITCLACVSTSALRAPGQILKDLPAAAQGIDVEDKVGQFIPLDLVFTDDRGNKVGLGKYFKQGKPVILTLNYSDCPGLCIAQLDNLVANLREPVGEGLGDRFEIVTVSIDPFESTSKAAGTKAKYVGMLKDTKAETAWHFLTGEQSQIAKLASSVGFKYTYDKANKRYNHAAVTYFISSDGRVCRYLLSLGVEPDQLKLAIADANEGRLTTSISDVFIQLCYMYDPDANRYSANARSLMALGGAAFTLMIFGLTAPFWFSRRGAAKAPIASTAPDKDEPDRYTST